MMFNFLGAFFIRLHCMHTVHKMWPIATDVALSMVCVCVCLSVCLSACVLVTQMWPAKTVELIEMPFLFGGS